MQHVTFCIGFDETAYYVVNRNRMIFPPVNNTCEPVISPLDDNIKLLLEDLILLGDTWNPPIDAEANLASPSAFIEEDAFKTVEVVPPILAGTNI